MPTLDCPSRELLQGFALGDLPDPQIEAVTDHLESCTECEQTVALFEDQSDTFIGRLRAPVVKSRFADEPEFHRAVAAANAVAREPSFEAEEAAEPMDESLGRLGEYQLLAKLGHGGMGTVYKAMHTRLRRVVALKILATHRRHNPAEVERFAREIEAVGTLSHANIVTAHDAGEEEDVHYLVMELVDGVDLHTLVAELGSLPIADACEIIRQAACGLQHAHEHGFVHRDLKPSNLLLSRDGQVKVLDLGLALLQGDQAASEHLTGTGQVMGTLDYMAPEQADDSHGVDVRADVYSLGCTLYKLLSGQAPFRTGQYDTPAKKIMAHAQVVPPPIQSHREDVPDELAHLLDRMLAKDPAQRPATPAEIAAALATLAAAADPAALAAQIEDMPAVDVNAASADEIPVMLRGDGPGTGRPLDKSRGRRPPHVAWLWFGWALVATAFICLGLTIASLGAAYRMAADGSGSASGLAHGISDSLRYMQVGVPAFLAGVIVLVVTYLKRMAVDLQRRRRRIVGQIAVIGCVLLLGGIALGQIVVRIRHPQGTETVIKAPEGSQIEIGKSGEIVVTTPRKQAMAAGEVTDGLRLSLAVFPTSWDPKIRDVAFTCAYRNESDKPMHVLGWGALFHSLEIVDLQGNVVELDGGRDGTRPLSPEMFAKLAPGESKLFTLTGRLGPEGSLIIHFPAGDVGAWRRLSDGAYRIRAVLDMSLDGDEFLRGKKAHFWRGRAESGLVEVSVRGVSGPAADTGKRPSGGQPEAAEGPVVPPDPLKVKPIPQDGRPRNLTELQFLLEKGVASFVLRRNGTLVISADGKLRKLSADGGDVPKDDFLIREINLGGTGAGGVELIAGLSGLTGRSQITSINLNGTSAGDGVLVFLKECKTLEELVLSGTNVTDDGLDSLKSLPKLTYLELADTEVTAGGVAALQKAHPKLKIVTEYDQKRTSTKKVNESTDEDAGELKLDSGGPGKRGTTAVRSAMDGKVTRLLDSHRSEARILEQDPDDPIMPGDRVSNND